VAIAVGEGAYAALEIYDYLKGVWASWMKL
jgi:hypothetical protein